MSEKIIAHTLVKNEEKYLWFSVMSVINYVDKVFIWDTGSTDKTLDIIKEIEKARPGKVYFKEVGNVDINEFTSVRQKMLEETESDWFLILDGDEVWWEDGIREVISIINERGDFLDSIVSSYKNIVGDIYHYQEESAGGYRIDERRGHFNIRAVSKKIEGIHYEKPHGQLALVNGEGISVQDMNKQKRFHTAGSSYLHFTNLRRSSKSFDEEVPKRAMKFKYELGDSFPLDFYYPEVFFRPRPKIVPDPWVRRDGMYELRAVVESPLRNIKRKFFSSSRSGY